MTYLERLEQIRILQKQLSEEKSRIIKSHVGCSREELRNKIADEMVGKC